MISIVLITSLLLFVRPIECPLTACKTVTKQKEKSFKIIEVVLSMP